MRRLTAVACLVAALAVPLATAAGVAGAASGKFSLVKVTARVVPPHINSGPYNWTESGTLVQPAKICPFGPSFPQYCFVPPKSSCNGKMKLIVKLAKDKLLKASNKQIGKKIVNEKNCVYRIPIHFKKSVFTAKGKPKNASSIRHVHVIFYATFLGNNVYKPAAARRQVVIGKVLAP